jgi:hypothetical protein
MASSMSDFNARRYSADELLRMKSELPVVSCVVAKLNKHPDIGT